MRARSFSLGGLGTEPFLRAEYDQRPRRDQNGAQKLAPPPAPCPPTSLCTHEILERERAHACIACTHTNRHACVHAQIQECTQIPAHAVRERVCACAHASAECTRFLSMRTRHDPNNIQRPRPRAPLCGAVVNCAMRLGSAFPCCA